MKRACFLIFLFLTSCTSTKDVIVSGDNVKLTTGEFKSLIQKLLDLKQFDYLYTEEEKSKGLSIVINEFVRPYYKDLKLKKFNKKVRFRTHKELYSDNNEKFMDIPDGSIIFRNDTLNIIIGLRFDHTAIHGKFVKGKSGWEILNIDSEILTRNSPKYNFRTDKEQCLAYKILIKKFPEKALNKKYAEESCNKYNFEN